MFTMPAIMESIISIIYPPVCAGCNKPNHSNEKNIYICNECYYNIKRHVPPFCQKCGRGLMQTKDIYSGACSICQNRQYYFNQAWSICSYEGIIKELIHKFKYNQKVQYKAIFEDLFNEFIETFNVLSEIDLIIPIPLHPARLREREYNQSQVLASIVSKIINKPSDCKILFRRKNTKSQINLNEEKRFKNIADCFAIKNSKEILNKSILLIDDVFTTGITLSEAAKVISKGHPKKISILTLAS